MNETELHDVFQTLTRNPAPSRYETGSVRAASRRKKRQKWSALGAAVLVGAVIAGTTLLFYPSDSASPADVSPSGVVNLEGDWVLTGLNTADGKPWRVEPRPGVRREPPTLRFGSAKLTVFFGCNSFDAEYKQSGQIGQDLLFDNFGGMRGVDCDQPPLYERLLDVRHAAVSNGVLNMLAEDRSTIATLERVPEPINIEGEWVLTALTRDGFPIDLQGSRGKTPVRFTDGQIDIGNSECSFSASYEQGDDQANRLTFSSDADFAVEHSNACLPEKSLFRSLPEVRYVSNDNGKLQLLAENGVLNVAVLERALVQSYRPFFSKDCAGTRSSSTIESGWAEPGPDYPRGTSEAVARELLDRHLRAKGSPREASDAEIAHRSGEPGGPSQTIVFLFNEEAGYYWIEFQTRDGLWLPTAESRCQNS